MSELIAYLMAVPLGFFLLLISTVIFDLMHVSLHAFYRSRWSVLRKIGALHNIHHQFLDQDLQIHKKFIKANLVCHVIPEFSVQIVVTLVLGFVFPCEAVIIALGLESIVFLFIIKPTPGFDINHHFVDKLKAYRPLYFCVPEYHLLHHVYPNAYFSSWIKTLDHALKTGISLQDMPVAVIGSDTDTGELFAQKLQAENCSVIKIALNDMEGEYFLHEQLLKQSRILVLCQKPQSDNEYQYLIEYFCELHREDRFPVEIWTLFSAQYYSRPDRKKAFIFAKTLFKNENFIYRHLVLSGNAQSKTVLNEELGKIMNNIKRGFNYVPAKWNKQTLKHCWLLVLK